MPGSAGKSVQDYPPHSETLGYFPTAGQVVCCSKIALFTSISLGFTPLTLPVANCNYKKFLPTLDPSVRKFHHTRKCSHFITFPYDFLNCSMVSLLCIRFWIFFLLQLLQTYNYTRETCDDISSWYILLYLENEPGLGYKMSSVPVNFARFCDLANSWDYKQHCIDKKQETTESLT